jgi:hypothetical protein
MKPLYTKVEINNDTQTDKLSLKDQLRLIGTKMFSTKESKLEDNMKISQKTLELETAFLKLINDSIAIMKDRGKTSVLLKVSSKFKEVYSTIDYLRNYYNFEIVEDNPIILGVDYFFKLRISEKER